MGRKALKTAATEPVVLTLVPGIETWGARAHGANLEIDHPFIPSRALPWIVDIENNQDGSCAGIGITNDGKNIFFYTTPLALDVFCGVSLVGHNVKYDVQMLRSWGYNITPDQILWDTQLAEYVRNSTTNNYGLKNLVKEKFGATYPTYKELCGTGKKAISIGSLPLDTLANYNGCDVLFTYKLYQKQLADLTDDEQDYLRSIELPTLRVLLEMEERGVQIDAGRLRSLEDRFTAEISEVVRSIRNTVGAEVNLNSPVQIKRCLLEKAGIKVTSTASEELHKHDGVPLVKNILRYRGLTKLKGTYTTPLIEKANGKETYRLHARFNQTITHTGRLSSSDPNLQNIPTRTDDGDAVREAFVAKEGFQLIDADYSQIEPRLMAHFSDDPKLLEIFRTGQDLYDAVAAYVGCDRAVAKTLWLALAYNAGAFKIAKTAGISINRAQQFLEKMKEFFSVFFYWKDSTIAQAQLDGYVTTLFGRQIPLTNEWSHLAPNYKVQGSAAEIMKLAIVNTSQFGPVSTVHDELIFEVQDTNRANEIKEILENVVSLKVPLIAEVGIGKNWRGAKS